MQHFGPNQVIVRTYSLDITQVPLSLLLPVTLALPLLSPSPLSLSLLPPSPSSSPTPHPFPGSLSPPLFHLLSPHPFPLSLPLLPPPFDLIPRSCLYVGGSCCMLIYFVCVQEKMKTMLDGEWLSSEVGPRTNARTHVMRLVRGSLTNLSCCRLCRHRDRVRWMGLARRQYFDHRHAHTRTRTAQHLSVCKSVRGLRCWCFAGDLVVARMVVGADGRRLQRTGIAIVLMHQSLVLKLHARAPEE